MDRYYGDNALHPTGPALFYSILKDYDGSYKVNLKETGQNKIVNKDGETIIINKIKNHQRVILKNRDHYTVLWSNRRIYKWCYIFFSYPFWINYTIDNIKYNPMYRIYF